MIQVILVRPAAVIPTQFPDPGRTWPLKKATLLFKDGQIKLLSPFTAPSVLHVSDPVMIDHSLITIYREFFASGNFGKNGTWKVC